MEHVGDGEIAQWLRAGTAIAKDPSLVPNTLAEWLRGICNSSSSGSVPLFWPSWVLHSYAYALPQHKNM